MQCSAVQCSAVALLSSEFPHHYCIPTAPSCIETSGWDLGQKDWDWDWDLDWETAERQREEKLLVQLLVLSNVQADSLMGARCVLSWQLDVSSRA